MTPRKEELRSRLLLDQRSRAERRAAKGKHRKSRTKTVIIHYGAPQNSVLPNQMPSRAS